MAKNPDTAGREPKPNKNPTGKNGYPESPKTTGIEIRGCKNTQKGKMARGPMA